MYRRFFKRFFDVFISLVGLLVLSPLIIFLVFSLGWVNRGKPFFIQKRPGKDGRVFKIIKFKTMNDNIDSSGKLLPDVYRLTRVGAFVRKTSLDEIPQLFNVLLGDMSLVGPRPLLVEYLRLYNVHQRRRLEVRPGITGWAQINGRNAISWKKKFDLDVWYVDNYSMFVDLKILAQTVKKVLVREGISGEGVATMDAFKGNE